jgi:hypothetical protein
MSMVCGCSRSGAVYFGDDRDRSGAVTSTVEDAPRNSNARIAGVTKRYDRLVPERIDARASVTVSVPRTPGE